MTDQGKQVDLLEALTRQYKELEKRIRAIEDRLEQTEGQQLINEPTGKDLVNCRR